MNAEELEEQISSPDKFKEIWLQGNEGKNLCALVNNDLGWLMYLRHEGDSGLSTRNPNIKSEEQIEFSLNNGQLDFYPKNWTYPKHIIKEALLYFIHNNDLPPQVEWHEDED